MTNLELNELYNEKIDGLQSYIQKQANGDDDLAQEQYIGVFLAIKESKSPKYQINRSYLKTRAKWNMIKSIKKGSSIDNGFWKREALNIIRIDQIENDDIASNILRDIDHKPVDEQVIEKISFEQFIERLSNLEKIYVHHRIVGWSIKRIAKKLKLSKMRIEHLNNSVRFKISEVYA